MTHDQTLKGRIEQLQALGAYVSDDILIVPNNRKLDVHTTYLKYMTKASFTRLLHSTQEVFKEKRT